MFENGYKYEVVKIFKWCALLAFFRKPS
jgi:hypothetical protein